MTVADLNIAIEELAALRVLAPGLGWTELVDRGLPIWRSLGGAIVWPLTQGATRRRIHVTMSIERTLAVRRAKSKAAALIEAMRLGALDASNPFLEFRIRAAQADSDAPPIVWSPYSTLVPAINDRPRPGKVGSFHVTPTYAEALVILARDMHFGFSDADFGASLLI